MPLDDQAHAWNDLVGRLLGSHHFSAQFVMDDVQLCFDAR